MYQCSRCGHSMFTAMDRCPQCGVSFSGVKCQSCAYVGSKSEFQSRGDRCPKCNSTVYYSGPAGYSGGGAAAKPLFHPRPDFSRLAGVLGIKQGRIQFPAALAFPLTWILGQIAFLAVVYAKNYQIKHMGFSLLYQVVMVLALWGGCFLAEKVLGQGKPLLKVFGAAALAGLAYCLTFLAVILLADYPTPKVDPLMSVIRPLVVWTLAPAALLGVLTLARRWAPGFFIGYALCQVGNWIIFNIFLAVLGSKSAFRFNEMFFLGILAGGLVFALSLHGLLHLFSRDSLE